jgi:hypothetical protein
LFSEGIPVPIVSNDSRIASLAVSDLYFRSPNHEVGICWLKIEERGKNERNPDPDPDTGCTTVAHLENINKDSKVARDNK